MRIYTIILAIFALFAVISPVAAANDYAYSGQWEVDSILSSFGSMVGAMAVDPSGNVYVSEMTGHRMMKYSSSGDFITQWGKYGHGDGQFRGKWFGGPQGIAFDKAGNFYVSDSGNDRIQKFSPSGAFITKWGSTGSMVGQFGRPTGVAVDSNGDVYIVDSELCRIQKFTSTGVFITIWGMPGSNSGQFKDPEAIALDKSGNVYVADVGNHRIQKFASSGAYLTQWGSEGEGAGQFGDGFSIAVDSVGDVYVTDFFNGRIQKFSSSGDYRYTLKKWGSGKGQLENPSEIAIDASDNIFVSDKSSSDSNNAAVLTFKPLPKTTTPTERPPLESGPEQLHCLSIILISILFVLRFASSRNTD